MNKLFLIIEREFLAKVRNRTFIIMTFLSPLLMVGMIALVALLTKSSIEKNTSVAYVDESGLFSSDDLDSKTIDFENMTEIGLDKAKILVRESSHEGLLYIPNANDVDKIAEGIQFFSEESPSMITVGEIENLLTAKMEDEKMRRSGIDLVKLRDSKVKLDIRMSNFSGVKSSKLINGIRIGMGMAAGYLIMMFILIYGAMVMRSVIEEKTSRIIEVIISSVKPFQLMLGKIFGTAAAGLTQFLIWGLLITLIFVGSSYFFGVDLGSAPATGPNMAVQQMDAQMEGISQNESQSILTELMSLPLVSMFAYFILYFLLGYLLYSSLYAAIGAAVDNETDTQQFMLPVLLPLVLGVYIGFATVINDPHGTIATVFSMIPFTSPIVMLMRIPFGVPWWQIAISLTLLLITFIGVVWVAAKIYRVGILMYGKKTNYKELLKWIRY
jgi:ABC-2 type transport system permease protein